MKRNIHWDNRFKRAFQKTTRKHPELLETILDVIQLLSVNPFHKNIETHKLKGELEGYWSCTVQYDCRIVFNFHINEETQCEEIVLLNIGTHEEVY